MKQTSVLRRAVPRRASFDRCCRDSVLRGLPASVALVLAACAPPPPGAPAPRGGDDIETVAAASARVLDDFEQASSWTAAPASGVTMELADAEGREGRALRVDFDFGGGGGWAALRRELPVTLPENYELSFWLRGDAPVNTLEFKLIDGTGENVWWVNRREFEFDGDWRLVRLRKRHVTFAWGPAGGGDIRDVAAIEFAITAGTGGRGTVWLDRLELTPLEPVRPYDLTPVVSASAQEPGGEAVLAMDGDPATAWRAPGGVQSLTVDFLRVRELGGLILTWDAARRPADYDVRTSRDARTWETIRAVRGGAGPRDYLLLPETEARWLRIALLRGDTSGYVLRDVAVQPIEWGESRNTLFETMAADARRGLYPKSLLREQSYWTVVGVDGGAHEALINEEGAVEVGARAFSLEPFLAEDGRLTTWADAEHTQSLEAGSLPVPSVLREAAGIALTVTAWAAGPPAGATLWLRYRVENRSDRARSPTLHIALRPFQVHPPWQFLNTPGGVATVRTIDWDGRSATVNGDRRVVPVTPPAAFAATTLDGGEIARWLEAGATPPAATVEDPAGHASGAFAYPLPLPPGTARDVWLTVPLAPGAPPPASAPDARAAEASRTATVAAWERTLGTFSIDLPAGAPDLEALLRSAVAYILINRDGPAIQPGSRSYERSWIRDGSLTSAALLRLGHADVVRDFIRWYAPFQYEDGKVPCCVDARGADPVPENDSHGQLIFVIAEYLRYTGDRALAQELWPHVERAVSYIDSLRHARMTPEYAGTAFYGLVPESISHEGYSAKPMHSYWDDFFTLLGLKDAAFIAQQLGRDDERARFAAVADAFRADLLASIDRTLALHGIDFIPGAVELGDFDATSTTVALAPAGEAANLPQAALARTFEKYWENAVARMQPDATWEAYTPYELRAVGTFVRLGARGRAHVLLDWFLDHQRPTAWRHWAEVVFRDAAAPRFIGDMPHGWVASDFIRSVVDMFVYDRAEDGALVIGAGIRPEWLRAHDARIAVAGLRTPYGTLDYSIRRIGDDVIVELGGDGRVPPGGFVIRSPLDRPIARIVVDGRSEEVGADEVTLPGRPRTITLRY